jgi:archaellum component FlaC
MKKKLLYQMVEDAVAEALTTQLKIINNAPKVARASDLGAIRKARSEAEKKVANLETEKKALELRVALLVREINNLRLQQGKQPKHTVPREHLETVAQQRDDLAMKNRALGLELEALKRSSIWPAADMANDANIPPTATTTQ